MFQQSEQHTGYHATVSGKHCRTIVKNASYMNSLWAAFNRYAKGRGFTEPTEGEQYLGGLAWRNPSTGLIMELQRAD